MNQFVFPTQPVWLDKQAEHIIVAKSVQAAQQVIAARSHAEPAPFTKDARLAKETGELLSPEERMTTIIEGVVRQAITDATAPLPSSRLRAPGTPIEMAAVQVRGAGDNTSLTLSNELKKDLESKRFTVVTELFPAVKEALDEGLRQAYIGVKAAQFAELQHRDESKIKGAAHKLKYWVSDQARQVIADYSEKTLSHALNNSGYDLAKDEVSRLESILQPALKSAIEQYSAKKSRDLIPEAPQGIMRILQKGDDDAHPSSAPANRGVEKVLKGLSREELAHKAGAPALSAALAEAMSRLSDAKSFDKSQEVANKR